MLTSHRGFTLIEAAIVIVITGIVAAVVAVFIRAPVQGYFDSARRAELTDVADTAVRRIARDLRTALPNSVRVTGGGAYLEFLQTRDGGRYRADGPGTFLDFSTAATTFDVLGPAVTVVGNEQNIMAVYNLGISGADAYSGVNTTTITGGGTTVTIAAKQFPFASPDNRFQIISYPVSYVCDGAGNLVRYWGYAIQAAQPNTVAALNGLIAAVPAAKLHGSAKLATNVSAAGCLFSYDPLVINQRTGLVNIYLQLSQSGENVSLTHEVHVSNVP